MASSAPEHPYRSGDTVELLRAARGRVRVIPAGARLRVLQVEQVGDGQRLTLAAGAGERLFMEGDSGHIRPVAADELDGAFQRDDLLVMRLSDPDGRLLRYSGIIKRSGSGFLLSFRRSGDSWLTTLQLDGRIAYQDRHPSADAQVAERLIVRHLLRS